MSSVLCIKGPELCNHITQQQMFFLLQCHESWGDEAFSEGEETGPQETQYFFTIEVICKVEANSDYKISQSGKDKSL